jgi:hypothetical protein
MIAVQVEPLADKFEELDASRAIVREDKVKQAELRRRLRNAQETQPLLLGGVDSISVGILTLAFFGSFGMVVMHMLTCVRKAVAKG